MNFRYEIIPEKGCYVERFVFKKENKEIKCGTVWKYASILTKEKPKFLENYDPEVGICLSDIKENWWNNGNYNDDRVIFFSETVPEKEQEKIKKIFDNDALDFEFKFKKLGWSEVEEETYMFGKLDVIERE